MSGKKITKMEKKKVARFDRYYFVRRDAVILDAGMGWDGI